MRIGFGDIQICAPGGGNCQTLVGNPGAPSPSNPVATTLQQTGQVTQPLQTPTFLLLPGELICSIITGAGISTTSQAIPSSSFCAPGGMVQIAISAAFYYFLYRMIAK